MVTYYFTVQSNGVVYIRSHSSDSCGSCHVTWCSVHALPLRGALFLAKKSCSTRLNAAEQVARLVASRSQIQTAIYGIDRRPNIDVSTTSGITGAAPSPRREFLRNFVLEQKVNMPKWIRCKRKISC